MHRNITYLIRFGIIAVLILAFVIINSNTNPAEYPYYTEPATSDATEPPEPTETEAPTETTTPETEPPATTEPPTEPTTEPTEPEPTETAPTETTPTYTEEELELLALVIYQEAGADFCSDETRLMVGTVVMNRRDHERYPDTIYEVVTQYGQYGRFYWTGPVWPAKASYETEAHAVDRAYAIALRILLGERAFPKDVIYQAEFPQGSKVVAYQDGLYFCR